MYFSRASIKDVSIIPAFCTNRKFPGNYSSSHCKAVDMSGARRQRWKPSSVERRASSVGLRNTQHAVYFHNSVHERLRTTKDENGTERFNVLTFKRANAFS